MFLFCLLLDCLRDVTVNTDCKIANYVRSLIQITFCHEKEKGRTEPVFGKEWYDNGIYRERFLIV